MNFELFKLMFKTAACAPKYEIFIEINIYLFYVTYVDN